MIVQMVHRWHVDFLEGRAEVHDEKRAERPQITIKDDVTVEVEKIIQAERIVF